MAGLEHLQNTIEQEKMALQMMEAKPDEFGKLDRGSLKTIISYHEEVLKGITEGKKLVLYTLGHPTEIFWAMDTLPVEAFALNTMVGGTPEEATERLDLVDNEWLMSTTCGFPRSVIGALASGKHPPIDLAVAGGHPCDPMTSAAHSIAEMVKAPIFYTDLPRWSDDRATDYIVTELKSLIAFLEEHTGKKLDVDRLREVSEESNKGEEYYLEINELRKNVPHPQHGHVGSLIWMLRVFMGGSPIATSFFKEVLDDSIERVKRGESAVPEEKIRVICYDVPHIWNRMTYDWMEKEWGAVVVMDLISYLPVSYIDTSSYDNMLRTLARKMFLQHCMERTFGRALVDSYISEFMRVYQDFKADCALVLGHNMDRNRGVWRNLLREICREKGIPLLVMDYDSFDPRAIAEETIRYNIEQFFTSVVLR